MSLHENKKSAIEGMNICAKGLDTIAFLSWFRVGRAMCKLMANAYRNTGINILKETHNDLRVLR